MSDEKKWRKIADFCAKKKFEKKILEKKIAENFGKNKILEMKILLLGSGALKIGEAGEFDYSGSQAIKIFRAAGHEVVLVNPNIATVQTDSADFAGKKNSATKIYFLPVTPEFVKKIIEKESPDAIALSFGGQTALNCGLELFDQKILQKNKIKILGTSVETIRATEDREIFVKKLNEISVPTPKSFAAKNFTEAKKAAKKIGFPLILRAAFALGGKGSGFCENEKNFKKMCDDAFAFSPQILVEEDLRGWKEIEYEIVRDNADNCIAVVNMENFDPLGIHTGESIVVSPSMTLNDFEFQNLRSVAIKTIRHLGIVGECNIQYALDPQNPENFRVIEVNARLSRSSALASKATGYPLAAVAAQILLGKNLPEIKNEITKKTSAFFEPALDYIALKIPRWDLQKFRKVSTEISTEMKSVGEVMSLEKNFPAALQKAIRMLAINSDGILDPPIKFSGKKEIEKNLKIASPSRIFAIARALEKNFFSVDEIFEITKIDRWFLWQIEKIILMKKKLQKNFLENPQILENKKNAAKILEKKFCQNLKIKKKNGDKKKFANFFAAKNSAEIAEIKNFLFAEMYKKSGISREKSEIDKKENCEKEQFFYKKIKNKIISAAQILTNFKNKKFHVHRFAVAEKFRGQNLGIELFEFCENLTARENAAEIFLNSPENAAKFYEKLGLQKTGEKFISKIDDEIRFEMKKNGTKNSEKNFKKILRDAKKLGFSDRNLAEIFDTTAAKIFAFRQKNTILPAVKKIDTTAAETPAATNFLYTTFCAEKSDF